MQHLRINAKIPRNVCIGSVDWKILAIIRPRNLMSRTIIVTIRTDAKLPMTALATKEDSAPSIDKSTRSPVTLKDKKEIVFKASSCNDTCV